MTDRVRRGSRPVIGVTTSCHPNPHESVPRLRSYVGQAYCDLLRDHGAEPILIPVGAGADSILGLVEGLLFPGGDDFDSAIWGEPLHPSCKLEHPLRFETERELFRKRGTGTPVLAICYGCQSLALMHGGRLIQHLPDDGRYGDHTTGVHEYRIEKESKLASVLGSHSAVGESRHHQGILEAGKGMKAAGFAEDGLIEAIELEGDEWVIGVQWHPEATPEEPTTRALFSAFVQAAS